MRSRAPSRDLRRKRRRAAWNPGPGAPSTNLLTEGNGGGAPESIALVNPATGEFIVYNMSPNGSNIPGFAGFPGTTPVGEEDGASVQGDPGAGFSYQYDPVTDSYDYAPVLIPCFTPGTRLSVPGGARLVEDLRVGDLVETLDRGAQPVRAILMRVLELAAGPDARHRPIEFKPGSLGAGVPARPLRVSPQHRILVRTPDGEERLAPAIGLTGLPGVRVMRGRRRVTYVQLVFARHEIVCADGAWTESFYPGAYAFSACDHRTRLELSGIFPELRQGRAPEPARGLLRVQECRALRTGTDPGYAQTAPSR